VRASNTDAREELGEVEPNDVFEKRKRLAVSAGNRRRNRNETRQDVRNFDAREFRHAQVVDDHRQTLAAVRNMGKRTTATITNLAANVDARQRRTTPAAGHWFSIVVRSGDGPTAFSNAIFVGR
jgi:hypothetical protein